MRVVFLAFLLSLAGCIHSRALERQCHQLRVGMPFATAYRTMTAATADCNYHTARHVDESVPACLDHRADVPAYVGWAVPVFGMEAPDMCWIDLDETGRVAAVHYRLGD